MTFRYTDIQIDMQKPYFRGVLLTSRSLQECIPVGCVPAAAVGSPPGTPRNQAPPWEQTPLGPGPPGTRPPKTRQPPAPGTPQSRPQATPPGADPPDQAPPRSRHPPCEQNDKQV